MAIIDKLTQIVARKLEPGEGIKAKVAGKVTLGRGANTTIVDGLVAATEHRVFVATRSFFKHDVRDLTFTQIEIPKFYQTQNSLFLHTPGMPFLLTDVSSDVDANELIQFIANKKNPPGKTPPPGQINITQNY